MPEESQGILRFSNLEEASRSIEKLEVLRKQYAAASDMEGIRRVRELGLKGRKRAEMIARNPAVKAQKRAEKAEIAEWFAIWLQSPDIFQTWLELRRRSSDFLEKFGGG